MTIVSVEWKDYQDIYPALFVMLADGEQFWCVSEGMKIPVLEQDVVIVAGRSEWMSKLPPVDITNDDGEHITLDGPFIRDPQLARLALDMLAASRAGEFSPRTIPLDERN
ncbi:MAG: hypothetical protein DWQ34_22650 [Planctomycetota bacterium]|nr:MAG: hypothetical protein DWQ34_22650 [Planctomycetota bacterium]REK30651.1 MAG: hypothetical protein DWQ41_01495 [Planctomycetota bacterium]REK33025.1 MAG: hypothetical protein DWQ45_15595 [Planctomycetota bacterium]